MYPPVFACARDHETQDGLSRNCQALWVLPPRELQAKTDVGCDRMSGTHAASEGNGDAQRHNSADPAARLRHWPSAALKSAQSRPRWR
jgi:hypothetical protein